MTTTVPGYAEVEFQLSALHSSRPFDILYSVHIIQA